MKTTNLFVELVVVGTGAALFVVLLLFTFFGDQPWLYQGISKTDDVASIIPVLSLIYVLGIVVDKIAYRVFKNTEDHLRCNRFKVESTEPDKLKGYYDARHHLYTSPNTTAAIEAFEYGRSKIRICRGWTVNSVLIILALICFIFRHGWDSRILVGIIAFGLLACGARWSWGIATAVEFNWLNRFHNISPETP